VEVIEMRSIRLNFISTVVVDPPPEKEKVNTGRYVEGSRLKRVHRKASSGVFLPDLEAQVKMIAMRGYTDDEMAEAFGVEKKLFAAWREQYPSFNQAVEDGRTAADGEVVWSLFKKATGRVVIPDDQIVAYKGDVQIVPMMKHFAPDTEAAKVWLRARQHRHWGERTGSAPMVNPNAPKRESKSELIAAIVGMIRCKPDNVTRKS
jgi:hypothetical protein